MGSSLNKDLRKKTNEELVNIVTKLKSQLLEVRFNLAVGQTDKQANAKEIRRTIARVLTILNERGLQEGGR